MQSNKYHLFQQRLKIKVAIKYQIISSAMNWSWDCKKILVAKGNPGQIVKLTSFMDIIAKIQVEKKMNMKIANKGRAYPLTQDILATDIWDGFTVANFPSLLNSDSS